MAIEAPLDVARELYRGEPAEFVLTFPRLPTQGVAPLYLHLSSPRVRFDLEGIAAP